MNVLSKIVRSGVLPLLIGCGGGGSEEASDDLNANGNLTLGDPAGPKSLPDDYEAQLAVDKQADLFTWVQATEYCPGETDYSDPDCVDELPTGNGTFDLVIEMAKSVPLRLNNAFTENEGDEVTEGRVKIFHPFGSVAKVELNVTAGEYTGMLAKGQSVLGVARLSLGGPGDYLPGMALKLLIDGKPSVNTHTVFSLDGQGENQNFFANAFSHKIPAPTGLATLALAQLFKLVKSDPFSLPIEHFASITPTGDVVSEADVMAPDHLIFQPTANARGLIEEDSTLDFRAELRKIPSGTVLWTVQAVRSEGDAPQEIGTLKTTSELIASDRGDRQLFFKHVK